LCDHSSNVKNNLSSANHQVTL